jgi:hypothetical protein
LKIWITPLASVAMLEKLALLKMAFCSAPALTMESSASRTAEPSQPLFSPELEMGWPQI